MEQRVAFLVEATGERISCLLNPESLIMRRQAGIQTRQAAGGLVTGANRHDDQLIYSGGGNTSLTLNLLFDVNLPGSTIQSTDVRDLTAPIWNLAENSGEEGAYWQPPRCRFFCAKSWNIPGVVTAVAERLESFKPDGTPQRSWLRLRMQRVVETPGPEGSGALTGEQVLPGTLTSTPSGQSQPAVEAHQLIGGPESGERLESLASRYYGDPSLWRSLAAANNIDDPAHPDVGQVIEVPPLSGGPT